ncbi:MULTISPECIES: hypothetical protein [unclassified Flavobacterium]|uniref:hypothetical protein n=1 Tax=unclassified Flavobacterium TaxID=196869 RepID=UPI001F13ECFC|nr:MULTISPECIES: hypothetical protein [unclassified Flavobacterium]UMY65461.1 hypothetical protein MKO97_13265 [Flavobacterium sp. HJ-32-4]
MYRFFHLLTALALFSIGTCVAQKNADFSFFKPGYKVKSSYGACRAFESPVIPNYGYTFPGGLREPRYYFPIPSLAEGIATNFDILKEAEGTSDTLVIQVRRFGFSEEWRDGKTTARFFFKAYAYGRSKADYHLLATIDTTTAVVTDKPFDVNIVVASRVVNDFLASTMARPSSDYPVISWDDIKAIDDYEKRKSPLYSSDQYVDGLYTSFDRLRMMEPSTTSFQVERNAKGKLKKISYKDFKGDFIPMELEQVYAIVENGIAYIVHEGKLETLYKREGELYFEGDVIVGPNGEQVGAMSVSFGIMGGALYNEMSKKRVRHEIRIRQLDGERIPERAIKKEKK